MPKKQGENSNANGRLGRKSSVKKDREVYEKDELSDSPFSEEVDTVKKDRNSAKRKSSTFDEMDDDVSIANDFGNEMVKILKGFSSNINKSLQQKRKKVEQYTEESIQATLKKVLEVCTAQSAERRTLTHEFRKEITSLISAEEQEQENENEELDKFQKLLHSCLKHMNQRQMASNQRIKALKDLANHFFMGADELEMYHVKQYESVHNDLKKDMLELQKKILKDSQQQELTNVRKHLLNLI